MEWYRIKNEDRIMTPSVLLYPDRIRENIRRMIVTAGRADRLRPHVKTHKIPQIVRMQMDAGITKFKCATLAEVKMTAETGVKDILFSYPLAGPGVKYFCNLIKEYPQVRFSVTLDNAVSLKELEKHAEENKLRIDVFIDIDNGMHRTGMNPGREALELARLIRSSGHLHFAGIHVYDGHTRVADFEQRKLFVENEMKPVLEFVSDLADDGIYVDEMVCGGSPSFPVHALYENRTLSPGTTLLWDEGYGESFSDVGSLPAAVLASRVISRPSGGLLCLDLGHKAVASEKPQPRVRFFGIDGYKATTHSEEHLVISTPRHIDFSIGQVIYGIPYHICPTMALHEQVYVVENNEVVGTWEVTARKRIY